MSFVIQQIFPAVIFKEPEQCVRCFIYLPLRYFGHPVDNVKHVFPSSVLSELKISIWLDHHRHLHHTYHHPRPYHNDHGQYYQNVRKWINIFFIIATFFFSIFCNNITDAISITLCPPWLRTSYSKCTFVLSLFAERTYMQMCKIHKITEKIDYDKLFKRGAKCKMQ